MRMAKVKVLQWAMRRIIIRCVAVEDDVKDVCPITAVIEDVNGWVNDDNGDEYLVDAVVTREVNVVVDDYDNKVFGKA